MIASGSILLIAAIALMVGLPRDSKKSLMNLFVLTVVVGLLVGRGNFLFVGDHETSYKQVCEYALFAYAVYYACSANVRLKRAALGRFLAFSVALVASLALLAFLPTGAVGATGAVKSVTWDTIFLQGTPRQAVEYAPLYLASLVKYLMILFVALVALSAFTRRDWEEALDKTLVWCEALALVCLVEVVAKYGFRSNLFHEVADSILGESSSTYVSLVVRGDGFLLCGFTKEASHYSFVLFVLLLMIACRLCFQKGSMSRARKCLSYSAIAAIVIEQVFSMSFSAVYLAACALVALFVLAARGRPVLQASIVVVCVLATFAFVFVGLPALSSALDGATYFGNRIKALQQNLFACMDGSWINRPNSGDNSTTVRLGSAFETLRLLGSRPLLGLGFSAVTAHSSFAMMIADFGLVGFALYCRSVYGSMAPARNRTMYCCLIACFLFMTFLASVGLRPFTDYWILVMLYAFRRVCEAFDPVVVRASGAVCFPVAPSLRSESAPAGAVSSCQESTLRELAYGFGAVCSGVAELPEAIREHAGKGACVSLIPLGGRGGVLASGRRRTSVPRLL